MPASPPPHRPHAPRRRGGGRGGADSRPGPQPGSQLRSPSLGRRSRSRPASRVCVSIPSGPILDPRPYPSRSPVLPRPRVLRAALRLTAGSGLPARGGMPRGVRSGRGAWAGGVLGVAAPPPPGPQPARAPRSPPASLAAARLRRGPAAPPTHPPRPRPGPAPARTVRQPPRAAESPVDASGILMLVGSGRRREEKGGRRGESGRGSWGGRAEEAARKGEGARGGRGEREDGGKGSQN